MKRNCSNRVKHQTCLARRERLDRLCDECKARRTAHLRFRAVEGSDARYGVHSIVIETWSLMELSPGAFYNEHGKRITGTRACPREALELMKRQAAKRVKKAQAELNAATSLFNRATAALSNWDLRERLAAEAAERQ